MIDRKGLHAQITGRQEDSGRSRCADLTHLYLYPLRVKLVAVVGDPVANITAHGHKEAIDRFLRSFGPVHL